MVPVAMESSHGVDVSWLHHSKDPHAVKDSSSATKEKDKEPEKPKPKAQDKDQDISSPPRHTPSKSTTNGQDANGSTEPKQNGDTPNVAHLHLQKQHPHHKQNEEAVSSPPATPSPTSKEAKQRPSESKRRGSWISNISSKFSSSGGQSTPTSSPAPATVSTPEVKEVTTSLSGTTAVSSPKELKKVESSPPASGSPKSGGPSFLQSALRRLSSSGGTGGGKVQGSGGICPRKVMNVDPYRERCQIDDLTPTKLRRVSFCVDVEIAPPVHYDEEEEEPPTPSAMIPGRRPSLVQLEKAVAARKEREKNTKMKEKEKAEGEALKHPDVVVETKEKVGSVETTESKITSTPDPAKAEQPNGENANGECKKKKKRTEAEKADRRERKRQAALTNGTIPMELTLHHHSSSEEISVPGTPTPTAKSQDRPTTDPLRIYRRCCQLRETPILKRIADQLSAPNACDPDSSGIITTIDLTGFKIPLADTITLGDWLALVPVRKLMLEDCDLIDEAVRVVLAGLLAVKTHEQSRFNRRLSKSPSEKGSKVERLGVIEKVSLKDNPRVSREGWRHIACFIHMSRSLKAIDISGIKLPPLDDTPPKSHHHHLHKSHAESKHVFNVAEVFEKSLAERIAKDRLEELVMAKCSLDTNMVESVIRGVTACGVKRLGLAYNHLDEQGVQAVHNFILAGRCDGLDLGGNDLSNHMSLLVSALEDPSLPLFALSVADCNLSPQSLKILLPAIAKLNNFRFIDLSHNHQLFETQPNAIPILRKYLPQMGSLRRMHLNDVAMDSEHCIALAEVLPEIPNLAHIGILDNPKLTALASAKDEEALQEEACAYYASVMAAVRVSRSIVSLDMEMPSAQSTELVKALGKQILAYALRNLERGPAAEALGSVEGRHDSLVEVPDILLHLVGHVDGFPENHDNDAPAPSEDYIVSGTGVVKALGICLGNKATDRRGSRTVSRDRGTSSAKGSGTSTPLQVAQDMEVDQFKAKEMSKNLLDSARKIRMRLQPALAKERSSDDEMTYRRLTFLDSTLTRMIERFEEEYPECRPITGASQPSPSVGEDAPSSLESSAVFSNANPFSPTSGGSALQADDYDDEDRPSGFSRSGSDASLAARVQAHEEGQMHRFGQQIRRSILAPTHFDFHHQASAEGEEGHLQVLRSTLERLSGEELQQKVATRGVDDVIRELGLNAQELKRLEDSDPDGFSKFRESQLNALNTTGAAKVSGAASGPGAANMPGAFDDEEDEDEEEEEEEEGLEMANADKEEPKEEPKVEAKDA